MAKKKIDLRSELRSYKFEFDLFQKNPCSKEENKKYKSLLKEGDSLPEGVYAYEYENGEKSDSEFYTIYEPDLTESEIAEYLKYQQLSFIRTIKNCVLFFTILNIIGMVLWFFILMMNGVN